MTDSIRARLVELIVPEKCEGNWAMGFNECRKEVLANIERLAESAKVVYRERHGDWKDFEEGFGPHEVAILLDIQPLSRKVKVSEIVDFLRGNEPAHASECKKLADRILREGVEHE